MREHIHLFLTEPEVGALSTVMQVLKQHLRVRDCPSVSEEITRVFLRSEPVVETSSELGNVSLLPHLAGAGGCSAAGLNVALADGNADRLAVARGLSALDHRVKAVFPQAIVLFPLAVNESQVAAFAEDALTGRVSFRGRVAALAALFGRSLRLAVDWGAW